MGETSFLDLPPELRNYVYEFVIANERRWSVSTAVKVDGQMAGLRPFPSSLRRHGRPRPEWASTCRFKRKFCPLLQVCGLIRSEVWPMVAAEARDNAGDIGWERTGWRGELYEEAAKLSLEITAKASQGGSRRPEVLKVRFGFFPGVEQMFVLFGEGTKRTEATVWRLVASLVSTMLCFLMKCGTSVKDGDVDLEYLTALLEERLEDDGHWETGSTK